MKKKDLIYLSLAAIIFAAAGILAYGQLGPSKSKSQGVVVEVIEPIKPEFDPDAIKVLSDTAKARNFIPPIDLTNGLGNTRPFNPL